MSLFGFLKQLESSLEKSKWLLILLIFALLLRLPSFFEPYWYGDEAIYLTIGHALNQGKTLYKDIVDHKTPIIYYLARVGSQLNFRVLLTLWMLTSYSMFYSVANSLSKTRPINWIVTAVFIVLTSLPLFEGLIPNGELFVMGFVLASLFVLSKHPLWQSFFLSQPMAEKSNQTLVKSTFLLLISGGLMGLAIMTKVPAAFDAAGVLLLIWFTLLNKSTYRNLKQLLITIKPYLWWLLGLFTPIVLSIIYFALQDALAEYLRYGLLYNFHYVSTWVPESNFWLASIWLSLKGKLLVAAIIVIGLSCLKKFLSPLLLWGSSWTILSLVAATLSNRPYPHYLLQVILPFCFFLLGVVLSFYHKQSRLLTSLVAGIFVFLSIMVNQTIGFGGYSSINYYKNFYRFALGKISTDAYQYQFNSLVKDNIKATQLITQTNPKQIYIWGTNPMLYAQTRTYPPDPFVVLFHLQDLNLIDNAIKNVMNVAPQIVVVMKNIVSPPQIFINFLHNSYVPSNGYNNMTVWYLKQ